MKLSILFYYSEFHYFVRKITKNICFLIQNKGYMHFFSRKISLFSHFCLFF